MQDTKYKAQLGALLAQFKAWYWLCACRASACPPHVYRHPPHELALWGIPGFSRAQYLKEPNCRALDYEK